LKKKKSNQEDDHEKLRDSIDTPVAASQGTLSKLARLSTRDAGFLCARGRDFRERSDTKSF
jgi:hypothetical protein